MLSSAPHPTHNSVKHSVIVGERCEGAQSRWKLEEWGINVLVPTPLPKSMLPVMSFVATLLLLFSVF